MSKLPAHPHRHNDWSQTDLPTNGRVSREMIGQYEPGDVVPSEAAKKITDAFDLTLNYLVGEGHNASFDNATSKRWQAGKNFLLKIRALSLLCFAAFC